MIPELREALEVALRDYESRAMPPENGLQEAAAAGVYLCWAVRHVLACWPEGDGSPCGVEVEE